MLLLDNCQLSIYSHLVNNFFFKTKDDSLQLLSLFLPAATTSQTHSGGPLTRFGGGEQKHHCLALRVRRGKVGSAQLPWFSRDTATQPC